MAFDLTIKKKYFRALKDSTTTQWLLTNAGKLATGYVSVYKFIRGEISVVNCKLQMVRVWTGFKWPIGPSTQTK